MAEKNSDFYAFKHPSTSQILDEFRELWAMALPISAMNCLVFFRSVVSVLFLGRLGSLELAGGALSIGFTNITGYSVLVGLAAGLEPVCSQAYGNNNWTLLILSLRRMIVILFIAIIPISFLWIELGPIMVALGQDLEVTSMAARYCLFSLPDLLTNTVMQPLRVFLRSQRVTKPMMYCSLIAVAFHVPLNYLMVVVMGFGVEGVAAASVMTNVHMVGLMAGYGWWTGRWRRGGGGGGDGGGVGGGYGPLLKLAVPSCVGICLEWWWYEIVTVLAGYLPNPKVSVAATGVLIQTTSLMYNVPMALAGCVSARVGNELGAGRPYKAKLAAMVALGCAFLVGLVDITWTVVFRNKWGEIFTPDPLVRSLVASVMPLIGLCELGNSPQTTGCGVLRGTARPAIGARINLGSFYLVGTPVAVILAFSLRFGFSGLWFGLLSAQAACAVWVLYVVLVRTDWEAEAHKARKLTGARSGPELEMGTDNGTDPDRPETNDEERKHLLSGK